MVVALFALLGGHWAILQGVAWVNMMLSYSRDTGSLALAAEKTFSGQYPCNMCRKIQEEHQKEEKLPAISQLSKKVEVFYVPATKWLTPPTCISFDHPASGDQSAGARHYPPPTPIPIAFS